MTLEEAILYAHQRMREIGKTPDEYHFEQVFVVPPEDADEDGSFSIKAYNEIYILIERKYFGLLILADNSGYNCDNFLLCGKNEFTGLIRFLKIGEWHFENTESTPCEFLRVVY